MNWARAFFMLAEVLHPVLRRLLEAAKKKRYSVSVVSLGVFDSTTKLASACCIYLGMTLGMRLGLRQPGLWRASE
jgi:hypothetical protein